MADISKIKTLDGTTYNLKDTAGRYEANLLWGGKNFIADYGPIDAAMIDVLGANRFAFLKPAGLTIEYSNDAGTTWETYTTDANVKTGLFGAGYNIHLGAHTTAGTSNINDQLRVIINTGQAGIYTVLNKIAIYMSTQGNTVDVKIEKALESTPTTYVTHLDWTRINGWSGWNILNIAGITTYGNTAASQYGRIKFTFRQTAINSNYSSACISIIRGFGGVGWATPSNLAKNGHLYAYDNGQNATFPAKVTATSFSGPLTGNVTGNVSGTAANVTGVVAVANGGSGKTTAKDAANVFLNGLDTGSSTPVDADYYISQFVGGGTTTTTYHRRPMSALWEYIKGKISSVLGLTATSYGGSAAKVNNHTVAVDVPANAKFTDTTYTANTNKLVTTTVPNITSVGSAPTLGTAIPADDITAWDAGSTPTLGTAIPADDITAWDAGSTPTLGTAIPADDITAWTTNTPTSASVANGVLTITAGSAASLSYTAKSIPNVTSVGSVPTLSYTAKSIPNVTSVGTKPSLSYTAKSIPNVTSVGSAPTLGTAITVATGSLSSSGGGATVATGITAN